MNQINRYIQTISRFTRMVLAVFLVSSPFTLYSKERLVVGAFMDGPIPNLKGTKALLEHEISRLNQTATDIIFPDSLVYIGDWKSVTIEQNFQRLLSDPKIDVILAVGLQSSHIAVKNGPYKKPVIAPFINNRILQGAPFNKGRSGVHNLTYLYIPHNIGRGVGYFHQMVGFKRLAFIMNGPFHNVSKDFTRQLDTLAREFGAKIDFRVAGMTADSTLSAISDSADAVYFYSLIHMSDKELEQLVLGLNRKKIPSYSCMGEDDVVRGIMVSLTPNPFPSIARRIGVVMQRILMGEDPATFPVHLTTGEKLTFNMSTARAVGFEPAWSVYNEARIIGGLRKKSGASTSLKSAVFEGIKNNLDLTAVTHQTKSYLHEQKAAWANLMPKLEMGGTGLLVEEEISKASMNKQPQYSGSIYGTVTQVLFSEQANTHISIQKHLLQTQRHQEKQFRLDIVLNVSESYLNVLRAGALETIRRENMERVRSYLQIARMRASIGSAGPGEVYRWESEIAGRQNALIEANASRNLAEIALNELLNRPQEQPISMVEQNEKIESLLSDWTHYSNCFKTKSAFDRFRTFMVDEAIRNAPELKALNEALAIQNRVLSAANRAFWVPTLALQGKVENTFYKAGAGSNPPPSAPDDVNWTIGANLSLPIYQGTAAVSKRLAYKAEMKQKQTEKASVTRKIEQRVRMALHRAGASYAGIRQAQKAAMAAKQGLGVVQDAYARGAVSITELTDAESQHQIAQEAASDAIFNYLLALMRVQRSVGTFDILRNPQEQESYIQKLNQWMTEKNLK